jgi:hypothetical protein
MIWWMLYDMAHGTLLCADTAIPPAYLSIDGRFASRELRSGLVGADAEVKVGEEEAEMEEEKEEM